MQRSEALDLFPVGALAQTQTERHRRLALATGFGSQAVWNRSSRRAGERGGARPRRHRIQKLRARLRTASLSFLKLERTTACEGPNVSAQWLSIVFFVHLTLVLFRWFKLGQRVDFLTNHRIPKKIGQSL